MVASDNKPRQDASPKDSQSPLPEVPARTLSPSVNSMEGGDKRTIWTPASSGMELRNHTLQLGAHPSLSPALDVNHITTTERSPVIPSGADISIQLQTELVAAANELYHKDIEGHVRGKGRAGKAPEHVLTTSHPPFPEIFARANTQKLTDEDYWSSFPPHIKQFAQKMYNVAQQMVQSDTLLRSGFNMTETIMTTAKTSEDVSGYPPGTLPSLPFDPSIFSDPEFALSVAALGTAPPSPGQLRRGPGRVEFDQKQHECIGGDYCSEDADGDCEGQDLDENEFHLQNHPAHPKSVSCPPPCCASPATTLAQVVLSYEETVLQNGASADLSAKLSMFAVPMPATTVERLVSHKKKKKVSSMIIPAASAESSVVLGERMGSAGSAPGSALEKGSGRTGGELMKHSLPLTANTMPAARAATKENISTNPPPSSRAQGKQPMSYAPQPTATTTTTPTTATATVNGQQPGRTARAASKAPIPAHAYQHTHSHHHPSPPSSNASVPQKHRPPAASAPSKSSQNNSKIWSTSSTEERERIKEFWLGLGEDERRNLVKIEKDTVLRKMKEQQKHSCSCAVCGRKRHAIEEELEVLYDAYYEELEQYANYQQRYVSSGGTIPPPPGPGPFPGSVELDKDGAVVGHQGKASHHPPQSNRTPALTNGRKPSKHESEFDDDEGEEDEYEEEEEYDEDEEEEEEEEEEDPEEEEEEVKPRDRRNAGVRGRKPAMNSTKANGRDGLFNLGSSLTVTGPGNILTVADDLLKNDGQKFLEMMEQLAERRMQREEEAAADVEDESDEEEDEEGDEDEEDEDEEDDDEDDDDEEVMTEEQKMEEGKRMFSIFAARMFEQRVLQAFREKVAQERQMQLLRELEDEDKLTKEREAKKQNQNQKKKAKKILQKQARDEERAAKAAEKAAEEVALKARQAAQEEAQRKKREEERARREAARKAADEEKQRKDEERRKRVAEEKEREAERERKRKEKEEKAKQERREREERERKAKEDREAKAAAEKAARDAARKEQQEKEEREKKLAKEKEEKERAEKERLAQQQLRAAKSNNRPPTSPHASGSTQRTQSNNGSTKKILNKPTPVTPTPSGSTPRPSQQQPQQQPQRPVLSTSQPATPVTSSMQNHFPPPTTPHYPVAPGIMPPPPGGLSSRLPFVSPPQPPFGVFGGPPMPLPGPPPSLAPSALPRNFGSPIPFDPGFSRPLAPTTPIGPPSKSSQNPLTSPTMMAPGPSRRTSVPDHGPVARPVSIAPIAPPTPIAPVAPPAPIARPMTGDTSGSGSGSPSRRSPSPKGILGSSALAADDDEVVPPPGRRIAQGAVGQSWGTNASPRAVVGDNRPPWGPPAPPGFGSPRPPMGPSLWGNVSPVSDWQAPGNFFPNSFVNHINSSPPHTGN